MTASSIQQLSDQKLIDAFQNYSLGNALVAEGTNSATIKLTNAVDFVINGQVYTKAATDNIAITATGAVASGTTVYYLVTIDTAGTVALVAPPAAIAGNADATPQILATQPANTACLAVLKVVATATYTPGTTDLGSQDTWAQICRYPVGEVTALTFA
jgi:hypothetical protein